jgi:hypothetical protein
MLSQFFSKFTFDGRLVFKGEKTEDLTLAGPALQIG